jgi:hypothetical protein
LAGLAGGAAFAGTRRAVHADGPPAQPLRIVAMFSSNATIHDAFFPTGDGLSPILLPLERVREHVTVLKGVNANVADNAPGNPHQKGMGAWLTGTPVNDGEFCGGSDCESGTSGWASGPSVDQYLAERVRGETPFASVELGVGVEGDNNRHRMSFRGSDDPVPPIDKPRLAFSRLFGVNGATDVEGSILDAVRDDIERLRWRADGISRQRMDAHVQSIRELEVAMWANGQPTCTGQPPPDAGKGIDAYPAHGQQMVELTALALGCGLTRIATLLWSGAAAKHSLPWVRGEDHPDLGGFSGPILDDFHSLTHKPYNDPTDPAQRHVRHKLIAAWRYYADRLATLAERLRDQVLADGTTMLDHTLILWGSEIARPDTHVMAGMPLVAVGGGAHGFRQGLTLDLEGTQINDVLSTITWAFGHPTGKFGHPDFSRGPISAWCDGAGG